MVEKNRVGKSDRLTHLGPALSGPFLYNNEYQLRGRPIITFEIWNGQPVTSPYFGIFAARRARAARLNVCKDFGSMSRSDK